MAVIGQAVDTLLDVIGTMAPDGSQQDIAEVLNKFQPILADIPWQEGNLVTGHRMAVRTSLPTPSFRAINEGVPLTKGGTTQIDETTGMLEDFSQVDRELTLLSGNPSLYRINKGRPHLEGMSQMMAQTLMYGNAAVNPKQFTGFAPRFAGLSTVGTQPGFNIIDAGGTGSALRSIYLIGWAPDKVFGIYPKHTKGGLEHEDATNGGTAATQGAMSLTDANGQLYMGYRDHWTWRCGLAVEDWRYVVRIANIDLATLTVNHATGAYLQDLMIQALERIQSLDGVNPKFYMPRRVGEFMRRQLNDTKNAFLTMEDLAGYKVMAFGEVEVKRLDALNVNETRVI